MKYPEIAQELLAMRETDQSMRRKLREGGVWDGTVDKKNTARLREMVADIGWPTISKVGEDASYAAWLIVQHADHEVEFQEQCLELMRAAEDDVDPANVALLTDRTRVGRNKLQVYGTQFYRHQLSDDYVPRPIEDEVNVNMRRASVGLPTLEEDARILNKK